MKHITSPRILLCIIVIVFILHSLHYRFVSDDAFISFRYAKNFINGHGLVWNIGEKPVEGYTNFLWVIIISLFMKVGFEPIAVSKVIGIFFGMCNIILVFLFAELILQRNSFSNLIAPAILACSGPFACWSTGGLGTQMFTFFILAGGIAYLDEIKHNKIIPFSAILFVLASLTRPEGLLIFGVTCTHRFFHLLLSKKNPFCRKSVTWFLTFLIIYGIYFYWRFNYYGFIFPNTFYAKTGGGIFQLLRGYNYFYPFFLYNKWPILLCLSLFALSKPLRSATIYLLSLTISYTGYIVFAGGDWMFMFRFFVPIVPHMAILVQEGIINFNKWISRVISSTFVKVSAVTLCSFIFILIITTSVPPPSVGQKFRIDRRGLLNRRISIGKWLHRHCSPDETVALLGIGAISYYSELNTIDRLGITDAHIAHTKMPNMGKGLPGHEKRDVSYVLSRKPTYFLGKLTFRNYEPTKDEIKKFHQLYVPFQIKTPDFEVSIYKLREEKQNQKHVTS